MAARGGVFLQGELVALSDTELLAHEIEAGSFLGYGVLHLQASIDLQEGNEAIGAHQVLNGAGAVVAGLAADALGRLVDGGALLIGKERRGGFLD